MTVKATPPALVRLALALLGLGGEVAQAHHVQHKQGEVDDVGGDADDAEVLQDVDEDVGQEEGASDRHQRRR